MNRLGGTDGCGATAAAARDAFDVAAVRRDFPILDRVVRGGEQLLYLDNAASAQKPACTVDAIDHYYRNSNANVHRGVHALSEEATLLYEGAREKAQRFLNAQRSAEIVFVRGATEGINLVANGIARRLQAGDEIIVSQMEHHSNIVPWQMACSASGAQLRVIPMNQAGELDLSAYAALLGDQTKFVALSHMSNALGTLNPVKEMIRLAHERGVQVLLDSAQAAPHVRIDVQDLDCDFLVLSGHKLYGPTGIGVLYGRAAALQDLPPYQGGGEMIRTVTFEETTYNDVPWRFEAGTPNIAGAVGLGASIDYLERLDWAGVHRHEQELHDLATEQIGAIEGVTLIGTAATKGSIVTFTLADVHPHDVGTVLDTRGIAVRAGHHCAQPVMDFYSVAATVRASFGIYNTREEVERLVAALQGVREVFL
ncbi:MAG: cysteine desulfurase [Planctomycetota bacterium]